MKKPVLLALSCIAFSFVIGCSVADDVKDTVDAVECASRVDKLSDKIDNNRPCSEIRAEIDKLLASRDCREFITEEQRAELQLVKDNCEDN